MRASRTRITLNTTINADISMGNYKDASIIPNANSVRSCLFILYSF
jgi:hypothetical protein